MEHKSNGINMQFDAGKKTGENTTAQANAAFEKMSIPDGGTANKDLIKEQKQVKNK